MWKDGFRMCLSLRHILQPSFQLLVGLRSISLNKDLRFTQLWTL